MKKNTVDEQIKKDGSALVIRNRDLARRLIRMNGKCQPC